MNYNKARHLQGPVASTQCAIALPPFAPQYQTYLLQLLVGFHSLHFYLLSKIGSQWKTTTVNWRYSRFERQAQDEKEWKQRRLDREERILQLEIEKQERENKVDEERHEWECERDEDIQGRAEERKAQHDMLNMFVMAFVGRSFPHKDVNLVVHCNQVT